MVCWLAVAVVDIKPETYATPFNELRSHDRVCCPRCLLFITRRCIALQKPVAFGRYGGENVIAAQPKSCVTSVLVNTASFIIFIKHREAKVEILCTFKGSFYCTRNSLR